MDEGYVENKSKFKDTNKVPLNFEFELEMKRSKDAT